MYAGILFLFSALAINSWCLGHDQSIAGRLDELERENLAQALISSAQERKINVLQKQLKNYFENKGGNTRSRRALQDGPHVSFTSFLTHDVDNIGLREAIVFDGVTHNDGNGYDNKTGIFTAPVAGAYFFTFFVGEKDTNQINVQLTKNGEHIVDAQAEGIATDHNSQGGNAAVVMLNAGDQVQVKHRKVGSHIEGAPMLRLTTFSGFLLYTTDSPTVIPTVSEVIG